jgi:hypothetical protein
MSRVFIKIFVTANVEQIPKIWTVTGLLAHRLSFATSIAFGAGIILRET